MGFVDRCAYRPQCLLWRRKGLWHYFFIIVFFFELCVQCFVDLFCLVCVLSILASLFRELLFFFSPPRGYCFLYALRLWCASVMVVAKHHHMRLFFSPHVVGSRLRPETKPRPRTRCGRWRCSQFYAFDLQRGEATGVNRLRQRSQTWWQEVIILTTGSAKHNRSVW